MSMRSALLTTLLVGLLYATPGLTIENVAHEDFGRLFSTPAERASLDYLRKTTKVPVLTEPSETSLEPVPVAPAIPMPISVQGYVKRSDGQKSTVWVNHQPMQENTSNSTVNIGKLRADNNQVPITLPNSGKNLSLKAGQVYKPETDTIAEVKTRNSAGPASSGNVLKGAIGNDDIPSADQKNTQP